MISAVCPEEIRARNRKKKNRESTWASKRWKAAVKAWIPGRICLWCGRPAQVAHHPTDEDYGKDGYFDLSQCWSMCNTCHWMGRRGFEICPKCRRHYKLPQFEFCRHCDPEQREKAEIKKIQIRKAVNLANRRYYRKMKRIRQGNKNQSKKGVRK